MIEDILGSSSILRILNSFPGGLEKFGAMENLTFPPGATANFGDEDVAQIRRSLVIEDSDHEGRSGAM